MAYARNREWWTGAITDGKIVIEIPVDPLHPTSSDQHKSYWIGAEELVNSDEKAFTELTDTPANYTSKGSFNVRVNVEETGLEFIDPAIHFAGTIHSASAVTEILNADEIGFWKAVGTVLRKITWSNIKATLKTYFDTLYSSTYHNHALNNLSEKSYNSLNDKPTIPSISGLEHELIAGDNIDIDRTDPDNPIISSTGGGGGTSNHDELDSDTLVWTSSGHTGTANRLMATGVSGEAVERTEPIFSNIKYGRYYNYYAVSNANFAPSGWHVPTQSEWETLLNAIDTYDGVEENWPLAGMLLKDTGTLYWTDGVGTNKYNFTAKGSGERSTGLKVVANYWTVTEGVRVRLSGSYAMISDEELLTDGYAVCLVKNNSTDPGNLVDIDGNVYRTVKIGNQVWVVHWACSNLNNGTEIPEVKDNDDWESLLTLAYSNYLNDIGYTFLCVPSFYDLNKDIAQAYSSTITFDNNHGSFNENAHTQSAAISFTVDFTDAIFGKVTNLIVVSDGNTITFPSGIESIINNSNGSLVGDVFTGIDESRYRIVFECTDVANAKYNVFILDSAEYVTPVKLNAPVLSSATANGGGQIDLVFTDTNTDPNESSIEIEYDTANTFDVDPQTTTALADATTKSVTGLEPGTEYFFRVKAVGDGVTSLDSDWSNIESETPATIIVMQDAFTGTTIDTGKWTETDPTDGVTITQDGQLIFTIDKSSAVASTNTNRVDSVASITNGCIQASFSGTASNTEASAAMSLYSSIGAYHALIQRVTGSGINNALLKIYHNSSLVYDYQSSVAYSGNTWRIRFDDANNTVYFEYLSALNTWTQVGTTQNYDIRNGPNPLYARFGSNSLGGSTGTVTDIIDNVYLTNNTYSTSVPL